MNKPDNHPSVNTDTPTDDKNTELDPKRVSQLVSQLDINNSNAVLSFGSEAQKQLTSIADHMLTDVKNKDIGLAGEKLTEMVGLLRGFKGQELTLKRKPSWWDKLTFKAQPIQQFLQRFENVSEQIDSISNELEQRKQQLLIDIKSLDKLYDANLDYYRELEYHISAAEQVLRHADVHTIPALKAHAEDGNMQSAQKLRDYQMQRDELDHRLHDLRLTKQVAMQALPSIRLVQENDKGLVNKINTTLINTVPLWRQQLAQSIAIYRSGESAEALKRSSDLTNELLITNAKNLKIANRDSRQQLQRGVFDIEAVEQANQMLIETIEESITIHEAGRAHRTEATKRLEAAEELLKTSLKSASNKTQAI